MKRRAIMPSVLIPIVNLCRQDYILCEIRSDEVPQPGEICLPGGHALAGETVLETAVRETIEELSIPEEFIFPTGEEFSNRMVSGVEIDAAVARIDCRALSAIRRNEHEVAGWFLLPVNWLRNHAPSEVSYDDLASMPEGLIRYLRGYETPLKGCTIYWDYEGRIIWGLTARLINSYLELQSE